MINRPPLFALLVGISEHDPESGVEALRGGVNDARSLAHVLRQDFGVPADDIVTLVDNAASLSAIESAVLHHLIARGKHWSAHHPQAVKRGERPSFLFHFSGYGIQARTDTGVLENALVAWDSLSPQGEPLRASELAQWVERLESIGDVTLILDCSTAPPAQGDETLPLVRALAPDLRLPVGERRRQVTPAAAGWHFGAATVIAACRPAESARERAIFQSGGQYTHSENMGESWYGSLTLALRERLLALPPGGTLSSRALGASLLGRVTAHCAEQRPVVSGSLERALLGGIQRLGDGSVGVLGEWNGLWWLDSGIAHGVAEGAEFSLILTNSPNQQCTLRVVRVEAERCGCRVVEVGALPTAGDRARLAKVALPRLQSGVRILLESPRDRYRLAALLDGPLGSEESRAWLATVAAGEQLRVVQTGAGIVITDSGGAQLAGAWPIAALEEVARALVAVARQHWLWSLRNENALTRAAALDCRLRQIDATRGGMRVAVPSDNGAGVASAGSLLVLDVVNRSAEPLFPGIFELGRDGSFTLLYPTGVGDVALAAGTHLALPLPQESEAADDVSERFFKVVATTEPLDWEAIARGEIAAFGALAHFAAGCAKFDESICWATEEIQVQVVTQPGSITLGTDGRTARLGLETVDLNGDQTIVHQLGSGVSLTTAPHFNGTARLFTARQAALLRGIESIAMPPGLAPFPELFAPAMVGAPGKRAALAMIELECDEETRKGISSESPLILRTPAQQGVALIALAQVGGGWYPVGRNRIDATAHSVEVAVEWLPSPFHQPAIPSSDASFLESGAGRQSLTRVIRLFLFRILDEPVASLGLFNVRFVPAGWAAGASRATFVRKVAGGELRYTAATPLRAGERVALLLHGVGGDSAEQALWLNTTLRRMGVAYDHVLAWEYEGVGTPIHENAMALGKALRSLGAGSEEGVAIDLYTHSMGGIIARELVERLGGDKIVRNVIFAAPPNLGTPLADTGLLAPWLIALGINLPLPTPSGILIAWAMGSLASEARGIADLTRRSSFLVALNSSERRVSVRYHLIAGDAALAPDEQTIDESALTQIDILLAVLAEGLNRAAGWYFEGENDLVVPVRSVTGLHVNQAAGSHVLTRILRCNHFGYYESETVALQVARWFKGSSEEEPQSDAEGNLWYDFIAPRTIEKVANGIAPRAKQVITFRHRPMRLS